MTADYAELERRVSALEEQLRHVLPGKIDAVSFGVNVLHEDVRAFREAAQERFTAIDTRLDRHGEMLGEILQRLPARPDR